MDNIRKPDVVTVAVSRVDGGVTILKVIVNEYIQNPDRPSERLLYKHYDITPAYIDSIIAKHVEGGNWKDGQLPTGWRLVSNDFVDETTDRTFRNAWRDNGNNKPEVDMPKAREIHRQRLRNARNAILDQLDVEYIRADEEGNQAKKKEISDKKQILRDITKHPDIDNATTPEQLKVAALQLLQ